MSNSSNRRGFLRGLTTLPLIGGGVTLIGTPTAVAEPITKDLLAGYADWLFLERRVLLHEMFPDGEQRKLAQYQYMGNRAVERFHLPAFEDPHDWRTLPQPSTRAALVLTTVGAEWRGGGHDGR